MSAEVAIIKNDCVVLAADSAVTIGNKHYNTDCKLFQLADNLPVGVMFFGCGSICGLDVATLLKMFRQQIRQTPKQNLKDYPDAFVDFLKANVETLFPLALQVRQLRRDADGWATAFLNVLKRAVDGLEDAKYDAKKDFLTDEENITASCRVIKSQLEALQDEPPCWNLGNVKSSLVSQVRDQIRKSISVSSVMMGFVNRVKTLSVAMKTSWSTCLLKTA